MIIRTFLGIWLSFFLALASCKTAKKPLGSLSAPGANPGACRVEGVVVSIDKKLDADTGTICSRYPCKAMVKVLSVSACGHSFTESIPVGDTVEMRFVYSLHSTKKLFPAMAVSYPGLKEGDTFMADAEQRLVPGKASVFIVFGYEVK